MKDIDIIATDSPADADTFANECIKKRVQKVAKCPICNKFSLFGNIHSSCKNRFVNEVKELLCAIFNKNHDKIEIIKKNNILTKDEVNAIIYATLYIIKEVSITFNTPNPKFPELHYVLGEYIIQNDLSSMEKIKEYMRDYYTKHEIHFIDMIYFGSEKLFEKAKVLLDTIIKMRNREVKTCSICGEQISIFKKYHKECYNKSIALLASCIKFISYHLDFTQLEEVSQMLIKKDLQYMKLTDNELKMLLILCWKESIDISFANNTVIKDLDKMTYFIRHFNIRLNELLENNLLNNVCKDIILSFKFDDINEIPYYKQIIQDILKYQILTSEEIKELLIQQLSKFIDRVIKACENDSSLIKDSFVYVTNIIDTFGISDKVLHANNMIYLVFMNVIEMLKHNTLPDYNLYCGNVELRDIPINFQMNEKVIWIFYNVECIETRERKVRYSSRRGNSYRIMEGWSYSRGVGTSETITSNYDVTVGTGYLAITDCNIYFSSSNKSFKVPFNKILSYTPYKNAVTIQTDSATSKPQTFMLDNEREVEVKFLYDLIVTISQRY